ncbi:alpha/beta hydrolase [Amphritea sp. 1_MG-2023]|uniref:alpha/beta fold hydrolase n=1 Tax=Amphritea sp. 1_MG-2023 TaxID=3062670 RepID=UPI0026E1901E|nr:alpha/beta hydrolase [Amphritea sp. 1_MG-2023]MDO6564331.1 alpha/beta hydrolase [Amphritea sp. 1_MG-2023]
MPSCMINDREIHYLDQGEGFPLLLGHGLLWDCRVWDRQLRLLSEHFRCIVPDLWSHGRSQSVSDGDLSLDRLAEDHHQLMQQLGLERYSVLGMSAGGLWGAKLAMKYPDEVASLVLISCYLGGETPDSKADYLELLDIVEQLETLPTRVVDSIVEVLFSPETQRANPALAETFRFDLMFLTSEQLSGIMALGKQVFRRQSMLNQLANIRCPTLIMSGEHNIPRPQKEIEALHSQMPGSQLAIIKNAGHMVTLEQPDQVNPLLISFLSSIDDVDLDLSRLDLF